MHTCMNHSCFKCSSSKTNLVWKSCFTFTMNFTFVCVVSVCVMVWCGVVVCLHVVWCVCVCGGGVVVLCVVVCVSVWCVSMSMSIICIVCFHSAYFENPAGCVCVQNLLLLRHHHEAESLHAVQKMDWEWKLKECGQCDYKSTPLIDEVHLPMVQVNDEFELLPPQRLRPS